MTSSITPDVAKHLLFLQGKTRQEPSDAPELTFYVYRASSEEVSLEIALVAVGIEVGGYQEHPMDDLAVDILIHFGIL